MTAEGGTGRDHAVTIFRSKEITGPYEVDPDYPMLTAKDKPDSPLQCSGHASLIQTDEGNWYIAYLRSEEHTSELQSRGHLVCRLLLEKKKNTIIGIHDQETLEIRIAQHIS